MGIIDASGLTKHFFLRRGLLEQQTLLRAVDGVGFSLHEGSVLALVGESGCGKSTVARMVLNLIKPTAGSVAFRGTNIFGLSGESLKQFRKSVQIIFQDPFASLNPRMTVFDTLSEPLKIHHIVKKTDYRAKVTALLESVGLSAEVMHRYPHEFSGGQRQRICIARTLAVSPDVIIADEPLSALDVSIQAQILNILQDLKRQSRISFLFISHDLRVVQYFSDEVAVMYLGRIVEQALAEELFSRPLHPYTDILLSSAPQIKPGMREKTIPQGDVPSLIAIPEGCPFHPRCPKRFEPCDRKVPVLNEPPGFSGRAVSCHLWNPPGA